MLLAVSLSKVDLFSEHESPQLFTSSTCNSSSYPIKLTQTPPMLDELENPNCLHKGRSASIKIKNKCWMYSYPVYLKCIIFLKQKQNQKLVCCNKELLTQPVVMCPLLFSRNKSILSPGKWRRLLKCKVCPPPTKISGCLIAPADAQNWTKMKKKLTIFYLLQTW